MTNPSPFDWDAFWQVPDHRQMTSVQIAQLINRSPRTVREAARRRLFRLPPGRSGVPKGSTVSALTMAQRNAKRQAMRKAARLERERMGGPPSAMRESARYLHALQQVPRYDARA